MLGRGPGKRQNIKLDKGEFMDMGTLGSSRECNTGTKTQGNSLAMLREWLSEPGEIDGSYHLNRKCQKTTAEDGRRQDQETQRSGRAGVDILCKAPKSLACARTWVLTL